MNKSINASRNLILPLRNAITQTLGLVGYWPVLQSGGSYLQDYSGRNNHLAVSGATFNGSREMYYDGVDDYCYQPSLGGKIGTVTASMVATVGFINDSGRDWSSYVRKGGRSDYIIVASDGTYKAFAYAGDLGTGETLGGEIAPSHNFTSGWDVLGSATIIDSDSFSISNGDTSSGIRTTGNAWGVQTLNKIVINASVSAGTLTVRMGNPSTVPIMFTGNSGTGYAVPNGTAFKLCFANTSISTVDFTSWSVQQVLTPTTNGVTVYSTPTGTTQSWTSMDAGFNANTITSYEIRRADFQLFGTQAFSLGGNFYPSSVSTALELPIFNKRLAGNSVDGFGLFQYEDDIRFKIDDADYAEATGVLRAGVGANIVGTFDGTTARVYVNGVLGATIDTGTVTDVRNALMVGYDATRYGVGKMQGHWICNKALSQAEVSAISRDPYCRP